MTARITTIAVLLAVALCATAQAQAPAPVSASYVALGDSFASGEGARADTFLPGTSFPDPATGGRSTTGCHRSTTSWAYRVAAGLGTPAFAFVACSGATIADITAPDDEFAALGAVAPPQIDAVTTATTLATLAIGGNDAGFARVLRACLYRPEDPGGAGCGRPGSAARGIASRGLRGLGDRLADAYVAVAGRMAPGGRLVVVGYPGYFAHAGRGYVPDAAAGGPACRLGVTPLRTPVRITRADARWLDAVAGRINAAISAAAAQAQARLAAAGGTAVVTVAPTDRAFAGHRLCDPRPWVNPLFLMPSGAPKRISLHPNAQGQAAYARAVDAAIP